MRRLDQTRNTMTQQEARSAEDRDASGSGVKLPQGDDVTKWMRIGIALLVLGMGGFLVWAATAPLDEGVPVPGLITVEAKRKTVQHLTGGIVRKIHVTESQGVREGEVLIELDDTQARANFEFARQTYLALLATESRLIAEQRGAPRIEFHPDLSSPENAAPAQNYLAGQRQLFDTRRGALNGDIGILNESAAGQEESLKGLTAQLASRRSQSGLLQEQLGGTRDLVKEGYLPRNAQLEQERSAAELSAAISELQASIQRTGSAVSELKLRAEQRRREYLREVETQLADVRRDVAANAERLTAAREDLRRTLIHAPADGQVVGLTAFTAGGVIGPGQRLMDIVPVGDALLLEARVPPHLIDRVHAGLPADIHFQGFVSQPQLVVEGSVISVSADLLSDAPGAGQTGMAYYLARVRVTPEGMRKLGRHRMQPGMPADVVIKTGERTLLTYLLKPLLQRLAVSLKES
jgi:protease secretion system membrane fusion protein